MRILKVYNTPILNTKEKSLMKSKVLAILSAVIFLCPQNVHAAEEHYDPQHTVLALNMAVVSIQ